MPRKLLIIVSLLFVTSPFFAQKLTIGYIYPAGGERGTTTEIEIGGLNITNATGVVVSGSGVHAELIGANKSIEQSKKKKNRGT